MTKKKVIRNFYPENGHFSLNWAAKKFVGPPNSAPGLRPRQYTIRNDPLKLKVDTKQWKHRMLLLNTCNADEYFRTLHRRRIVANIGGETKIWGKASILGVGVTSLSDFEVGRVAWVEVAGVVKYYYIVQCT